MQAPLATQLEWVAAVLRGHCGYYGRPHNYRRRQKSRRMGLPEFGALPARFRLSTARITRTSVRRGY
jgi:RNA-directed DNA polymerase